MHELASLIDPSVAPGPTLPAGHPFIGVQSAYYWSASSDAALPTFAWGVAFNNGSVVSSNKGFAGGHAWCVRGGMNAGGY